MLRRIDDFDYLENGRESVFLKLTFVLENTHATDYGESCRLRPACEFLEKFFKKQTKSRLLLFWIIWSEGHPLNSSVLPCCFWCQKIALKNIIFFPISAILSGVCCYLIMFPYQTEWLHYFGTLKSKIEKWMFWIGFRCVVKRSAKNGHVINLHQIQF